VITRVTPHGTPTQSLVADEETVSDCSSTAVGTEQGCFNGGIEDDLQQPHPRLPLTRSRVHERTLVSCQGSLRNTGPGDSAKLQDAMQSAESVWIHVELAPTATVTTQQRLTVERAFDEAGLSFEWRTMRGDPTTEDSARMGVSIAQPTLDVVLSTLDAIRSADLVRALLPELAAALTGIRRNAPGLPIGFQALTGSASTRFAFRPTATPESIVEALDRIETVDASTEVAGWDEHTSQWRRL
jgi:hypothetical protein